MYCPKCGTQNIDNASFCRACGTNLSLVPQALTGRLSEVVREDVRRRRRERKRDKPPSVERAIKEVFSGLAFIAVAIAVLFYAPAGHIWWFWMFIPAFMGIGNGIAEFVRYKNSQKTPPLAAPTYMPPAVGAAQQGELPPRAVNQDIYAPPASVTENTTRLLDQDR